MFLGRELHDLQQALHDLLDRWPRAKAASLDRDAQALLADAERLLDGIDELLTPRHESPGERAGGAARPRRRDRDTSTPGSRAAMNARRLADETRAAARRRRDASGRWA